MEDKILAELKKEIEIEMERKKEKKAFTLYLSKENMEFLQKEKLNISRMVDRFLSSMIVIINNANKEAKELKEKKGENNDGE